MADTAPAMTSLPDFLTRHRARLLLALRMLVAATLAYTLAEAFGLPQGYWAVLTTIIVIQTSIGGSLKAAIDRLAGSICGALVGAAIALALPSHTPVALGLALVIAIAPLAVLTAYQPGYRVAPVTAIIVLMSTGAATLGPLGYALDRVLEITLGSVVGVAVTALLAPARASVQLRDAAAEAARLLAEIMTALARAGGAEVVDLGPLPQRIQAALNRLATAAEDDARERRSRLSDHPDPEPLFRTLRRLQADILALHRLFNLPWPAPVRATLAAPWSAYADAVAATLRAHADALPARQPPADPAPEHAALAGFLAAIETLRRAGTIRELSTDLAGRILGSAFRVEQLQRDLDDLTERTGEIATT
jgi:uncharacterized membrane protein YccC